MSTDNSEQLYQLTTSKRALTGLRGKLVENAHRLEILPDVPPDFRPLVGSYKRVSDESVRRNQLQERAGFIDYLYHPELYVEAKTSA